MEENAMFRKADNDKIETQKATRWFYQFILIIVGIVFGLASFIAGFFAMWIRSSEREWYYWLPAGILAFIALFFFSRVEKVKKNYSL